MGSQTTPFDALRQSVDRALDGLLPGEGDEPRALHRAMRHGVLGGGKRLRPMLVILAGESAGASEAVLLPVACAVEMVHAYSLIHDDLPAMDDDDLRRGRPTCHRVFGEATAILAGDALLTRAFELIGASALPAERRAEIVSILAKAAGAAGMVGGQVLDLAAEGQPPDEVRIEAIHRRKTAALFSASAEIGAVAAGAPAAEREGLARFGEALGLAFQILDDLLDETGRAEDVGKRVRKDRGRHKMTYPALLGVERSRVRAREWTERAKAYIASQPRSEHLLRFSAWLLDRRS